MSLPDTSARSQPGTNGASDPTAAVSTSEKTDAIREQWIRSAEYRRSRGRFLAVLFAGATALCGGVGLLLYSTTTRTSAGDPSEGSMVIASTAVAAIGVALVAYAVNGRSQARAAFDERQERAAKAGVEDALERVESDTDLRGLLRLNRRQMEAYEALTRRQAASSYRLSHIALAVGFGVVVGGAIAALVAEEVPSKIAAAALAGIGATISGFIARTYLRIYERTLIQLNHYFEQPLVSSYVLTAERLIDKMNHDRRDDALATLIGELLVRLRGDAQSAGSGTLDVNQDVGG